MPAAARRSAAPGDHMTLEQHLAAMRPPRVSLCVARLWPWQATVCLPPTGDVAEWGVNSLFTAGRVGHGAGSRGYGTAIYTYSGHLSAWGPPRNLLRADSLCPGILISYYEISTGKGLNYSNQSASILRAPV